MTEAVAAWRLTRKFPAWLPFLLGLLQAVGPVSTDMYLPAFPAMEAGLHAAPGSAQLTLATWVAGLCLGQFLQGTLADRFGRRVPLVIGTLLYTVGSAGCALSGSMTIMAVWRLISALGASASMVIPRAIVRDVVEGHAAARIMGQLILIMGAAPILAPSLGGLVLQIGDWRDIYWIMTGYGATAFLFTVWKLPDTLPRAYRLERIFPGAIVLASLRILRERSFISHALVVSAGAFSLFAYLGGSPEVFIRHFHYTPAQYGLQFGGIAAVFIAGAQVNSYAVRRLGFHRVLGVATTIYLAAATTVLLLVVSEKSGPLPIAVALSAALGMTGFINPTATVGALTHHAAQAGTASALMGTLQFLIGASSAFLIGWFSNGTALPMALLIFTGGVAMKAADLCRPRV